MQSNDRSLKKYRINADVLYVFSAADAIGWKSIRESSIHRILYLASVLYSFRNREAELENPFRIYKFSIDKTGPYDSDISTSLEFLYKDEYLEYAEQDKDAFVLGSTVQPVDTQNVDDNSLREEWISLVVHILGIYSEDRIYDFIFRDPEYQRVLKSNTQQGLDTGTGNQTEQTLESFKKEFEETIPEVSSFSNQQYIELYFEYVFSTILKRDAI